LARKSSRGARVLFRRRRGPAWAAPPKTVVFGGCVCGVRLRRIGRVAYASVADADDEGVDVGSLELLADFVELVEVGDGADADAVPDVSVH
jgi:hypothetical protein